VVTADGGIVDTTKNAVMVIPEYKDEYYFIHITDTHLPTHLYYYEPGSESDTSEIQDLREVINDINIINPEFVLLTGDFINEGELEDYLGRRYYSRSQRLLTELEKAVYLLAGNHDIGGWIPTPMPDGTARRNWWKFFGWKRLYDPPPGAPWYTQNYSFNYGPVHYIGLESYRNYDLWRNNIYGETSFTSGQLQWLTQELANSSASTSQVLFYHYDFSDQINVDSLGVELAIWGHSHNNSGNLSNPPYNISTKSVCDGNRSYRLVRITNGIIYPSPTISAGQYGNNLYVQFQPANNGQYYTVTAHIENYLDENFEHSQLKFLMPNEQGNIEVTGGELLQVDDSDSIAVYYVGVNLLANSSADITVILDPSAGLSNITVFPEDFILYQNYPNPFNPTTTIKYQIPEISFVMLKVYDVLGNETVTLVNEEKPVGSYEVEFSATGGAGNLASGIYFYRLQVYAPGRAGSFVETKKMVLLR
jgi:predicted phosphodiesterase